MSTLSRNLASFRMGRWWHRIRLQLPRLPMPFEIRRQVRTLKLQEMLSLGEKRFVAIVQCEGQRWLIGGAANSVSLLARLPKSTHFQEVLDHLQPEAKVNG